MQSELWPIHPKPFPDEALSSWLSRLSRSYSFPLHLFRKEELLRTPGESDIDQITNLDWFNQLSQQTGVATTDLWQMSFAADEGSVYSGRSDNNLKWIAPMTAIHSGQRRYVFPHCPGCLAEDAVPYYRKAWRYSFLPVCSKHGPLELSCFSCGHPYSYIETSEERSLVFSTGTMGACRKCGASLRLSNKAHFPAPILAKALQIQDKIVTAIDDKFFEVEGFGYVHTCMYLLGLHKLYSLLQDPNNGPAMWRWITEHSNLTAEPPPYTQRVRGTEIDTSVESVPPYGRVWLLVYAYWLTGDWPNRLVKMADEIGVSLLARYKNVQYIPYWMSIDHLKGWNKGRWNTDEIQAAKKILKIRRRWPIQPIDLLEFLRSGKAREIRTLSRPPSEQSQKWQCRLWVKKGSSQGQKEVDLFYSPVEINRDLHGLRESMRSGGDDLERFAELAELIKRNERTPE